MRDILITLEKLIILLLIMAHPQGMKVCGYTSRPQRQDTNVRPTEFVAQRVGKRFLCGLVAVVDRLPGERGRLECRDGGDVQDGAGLARHHGCVQHGIGGEHEAVDVGVVHGENVADLEVGESGGGTESESGLILVSVICEERGVLRTLLIRMSISPRSWTADLTAASTTS